MRLGLQPIELLLVQLIQILHKRIIRSSTQNMTSVKIKYLLTNINFTNCLKKRIFKYEKNLT
jgi:hypothetical protein